MSNLLRIVNAQVQAHVPAITILLSSTGGDTSSAFAAYNLLRHLPIEVTMVNVGNVDSAAVVLFCAGKNRYSLPGPATRFLIHSNALTLAQAMPMDLFFLDNQLQQVKSLNQMMVEALKSVTNKPSSEIERAVASQLILTPEQAKDWGLVQQIRSDPLEPGTVLLSVNNSTTPEQKKSIEFSSVSVP